MPFDHVGASLSQLGTLRQLFDLKAADIESLIGEIGTAVGPTGGQGTVHWEGQVAERFRQDWHNPFVPGLRRLLDSLHESAAYVEQNRQNISQALNGTVG